MTSPTDLTNRQKVGLRVKALREARRLTQSNFAYSAGISCNYLRDVELGRRNISIDNIGRIADSLGVSLAAFFDDAVFHEVSKDGQRLLYESPLRAGEGDVTSLLEMPTDERSVITALRDDPTLSIDALAKLTGYSHSTVHRILRRLVDAGIVERVGSRKTGRWEVVRHSS